MKIWTRRLAAALGAAVLIGGVAACGTDDPVDQARSITVIGSGKVTGTPDTLKADVGIEAEGADVTSALNQASAKVKKVTDAVVAAGVERKDIQTQTVSLNPQYSSPLPGGTSQISGYQATNSLRITIRDLTKASTILAAAPTAGGDNTRISNVSFSIDDDSDLMRQAREAAFNDARSRAGQYADLAGDSLGKVLTITEATTGQDQAAKTPGTFSRADVAAAPIPVEPGQQTLTFTVTVKYQLD
ncbi:SIMPL domain-containing protein [Gordonia sp. TBRC 11910]|uniref:SIMPL domain-containing protein n=1 Tax=Gordonia asplenii TaxID=2725283 RepID=A0A848KUI9_9ACTN|nr:SIMPL domain-containing protein [Gordonia asplenii]NMO00153.1 SIMPL domain-containing protein [Gordonia asplenii]